MSCETAVELLRAALESGQLRDTLIEQRIRAFIDADGDKIAAVELSIGDDLLRWAALVDDEGQPTGTLDEIEQFGELVQSSSIPEACSQIHSGMLDARAVSERPFLITQTETFRVRATSADEALEKFLDRGEQSPEVEWLDTPHREVGEMWRTDMPDSLVREGEAKTWVVRVPITVTADDRDEAIKFALDDLRDPTMEWDTFEVEQTGGPHPKVPHGRCPVCGHYGEDCEGQDG